MIIRLRNKKNIEHTTEQPRKSIEEGTTEEHIEKQSFSAKAPPFGLQDLSCLNLGTQRRDRERG